MKHAHAFAKPSAIKGSRKESRVISFTLIELLVVIAIIAILSFPGEKKVGKEKVIVPNFVKHTCSFQRR